MLFSRLASAAFAPLLVLLLDAHPAINQLNESLSSSSPALSSPPPPSPSFVPAPFLRFLQFSVWAPSNWWLRSSNSTRILAIIECSGSDTDEKEEMGEEQRRGNGGAQMGSKKKTTRQMVLWLFTNSPDQRVPFATLITVDKQIHLQRISQCVRATEREKTELSKMEVEIELSVDRMFVRAKNAVRYQIPSSMDSPELRVYFIGADQRSGRICQLKSLMESKETSKFTVPPTTPHAPTAPPQLLPISRHSLEQQQLSQQILPTIVRIDHKWPYSKRPKTPRRSTLSAQRLLTPVHYATPTGSARRPFLQRKPQRLSPLHFGEKEANAAPEATTQATTTTATNDSYIDILRDRQLYEEVQRSKTHELNSRWSTAFFVFLLLVAFLITSSAAFALLLSLLLQCRPKAVKHSQPNIATIVRR